MRAIAEFVAQPASSTDGALSVVEHPACHIAMKKIIANDKTRMEAGEGSKFLLCLLYAFVAHPCFKLVTVLASLRAMLILI